MILRTNNCLRARFKRYSLVPACVLVFALVVTGLLVSKEGAAEAFAFQGSPTGGQQDAPQQEIAVPLPKGKKLILTDGSFQMVREYHREGDRVRYYSLERSAWEEIPATLVDWTATEKAAAQREETQKELDKQIADTEKAARFADLDVDTSFEVRPGAFLPDDPGFYVLDGNKIDVMVQEKAELHVEKGRELEKIISGVPLISSKQDMIIPGKEARLRVHTGDLEFYFRTADKREPHLTLLRAQVKGERRTVAVITINFAGQQKFKNEEVSLLQWDAARGLFRYTVDRPLEAGEYAIIEAVSGEGQSMYVWTFGVDVPVSQKASESKPAVKR